MYLSERTVWLSLRQGEPRDALLRRLPPERVEWAQDTWERLYSAAEDAQRVIYRQHNVLIRKLTCDPTTPQFRKQFAHYVHSTHADPLVWRVFDGKPIFLHVLDRLKPSADPIDSPPLAVK